MKLVVCIQDRKEPGWSQFTRGKIYQVINETKEWYSFKLDDCGSITNGWSREHFKDLDEKSLELVKILYLCN